MRCKSSIINDTCVGMMLGTYIRHIATGTLVKKYACLWQKTLQGSYMSTLANGRSGPDDVDPCRAYFVLPYLAVLFLVLSAARMYAVTAPYWTDIVMAGLIALGFTLVLHLLLGPLIRQSPARDLVLLCFVTYVAFSRLATLLLPASFKTHYILIFGIVCVVASIVAWREGRLAATHSGASYCSWCCHWPVPYRQDSSP